MTVIQQKRQNNGFAGSALAYDTREDEMDAFDALPFALRWQMNENATKLSSRTVANHLAWSRDIETTARKVADLERFELEVWAGRYFAETKIVLPHVAAGATVQRYGAVGESRHPPRRYGKARLRK